MPATRITIALNANQSLKTPLIIPLSTSRDSTAKTSCKSLVLKIAQSKLRLKKGSRFFVQGQGRELLEEKDWSDALRDDVVLLVSAGEDYVGSVREKDASILNPDCPVQVIAGMSIIDALAEIQLQTAARTLPGIVHACGQPDLHPGTKFPIGAVFVSKGWIHPPLIGGDIGCGMAWYRTTLKSSQVENEHAKKVADKLRGLEGTWRTQVDREAWLREGDESVSAGEVWDKSLGTIGAGNHFAEIQIVQQGTDDLRKNEVVLLVHSGSRGYGGDILQRYTEDSEMSLHEESDKAKAYLKEHDRACKWARANRDLIALRFLSILEPGEDAWTLGVNDPQVDSDTPLADIRAKLQERKVVDIWHNNVERAKWPPEDPAKEIARSTALLSLSPEEQKNLPPQGYAYIHRKGAAPTYHPTTNVPLSILPLPGSRGTPTLMIRPVFSEVTSWGAQNALSLAHGAGRRQSRNKAFLEATERWKAEDYTSPRRAPLDWKPDGSDYRGGTYVICDEHKLVFEEYPNAYKPVHWVAFDLSRAGMAETLGWCRPRISYKIRNER